MLHIIMSPRGNTSNKEDGMASILVRCPDTIKDKLKSEAEKLGISVNALVLSLLWAWHRGE